MKGCRKRLLVAVLSVPLTCLALVIGVSIVDTRDAGGLPTLVVLDAATNPPATDPPTLTDAPTDTPTATLTVTPSPTITHTPMPSHTPTITNTPEPAEWVRQIAERVTRQEVRGVFVHEHIPSVVIDYEMADSLTRGMMRRGAENAMIDMTCDLRETGLFTGYTYQFTAEVDLVDAFGNTRAGEGLVVRLLPEAVERINCAPGDRFLIQLERIAEFYQLHPDLR